MIVIFILILLSIVIAACFLAGFIWSVRTGQYEDTFTPSLRLLMDEHGGRDGAPSPTLPSSGVGVPPVKSTKPVNLIIRPARTRNARFDLRRCRSRAWRNFPNQLEN